MIKVAQRKRDADAAFRYRLSPAAEKRLAIIASELDTDAAQVLDAMVKAFGDASGVHAAFASYLVDRRRPVRSLEGVGVESAQMVTLCLDGGWQRAADKLCRRWNCDYGAAVSRALRFASAFAGATYREVEERQSVPF